MYFPDSAVLVTRFFTQDGVGEVVDFMPVLLAGARVVQRNSTEVADLLERARAGTGGLRVRRADRARVLLDIVAGGFATQR